MKTVGALALVLLAALAVPAASAAVTVDPTTLETPIPYEGSASLSINGTVSCDLILQAMADSMGPTATLSVVVASPPAWLNFTEGTVNLASQESITACAAGTANRDFSVALPITVSRQAPGIVDHALNITASLGGTTSEPAAATVTVAYHANYTIVTDAKFPMTVNGTEASFNVTVTQASNARSMVMIEEVESSAGVLSGMGSQVYENAAGAPASKTFKVTFKAPTGEWSNATASFTGYGHYLLLDGRAGEFGAANCKDLAFPECDAEGTTVTYSFVAGHSDDHHDEDEGDKKSPAPAGALLALGLVGLAVFARRRA